MIFVYLMLCIYQNYITNSCERMGGWTGYIVFRLRSWLVPTVAGD